MKHADSPVSSLRARLAGLRRRIHGLYAVQGLGRLTVSLSGLLLLFFVADRLLDLPLGVRRFVRLGLIDHPDGLPAAAWIALLVAALGLTIFAARRRLGWAGLFAFLSAGLAGLSAWLIYRLLGPSTARLSDDDLALAVEHKYTQLNDRLATALDFDEELQHPTRGESEAMMRAVVDDAAGATRELEFAQAVSGRRAMRWLGVGALGLLALLGVGLAAPETVGLFARRSLLLEDLSWPRQTEIVAVDLRPDGTIQVRDATAPYEAQLGRSLPVYALARGRVPTEVSLLDRVEGGRTLPRRLFRVPEHEGLFLVEIRDVRRPFTFVLAGGDDEDRLPEYRVEVVVPPRVLTLRADLVFPPYLTREDESQEGGNLVVPEGTRVRLEAESDVPVAKARLVHGGAVLEGEPVGEDGRRFAFDLEARETLRYRIVLETESGRESDPSADAYSLVVEADKVPVVRWIYPRGPVEATPAGRVPLLLHVEDDHAVSALRLEVRLAGEEQIQLEIEQIDGELGRPSVRAYVPLELLKLEDGTGRKPAPPDRLSVRLVATDSKAQTREGPWMGIDVLSRMDRERMLGPRRAAVRSAFELIRDDLRSRREQLAGISPDALDEGERDVLRAIQFGQAKIAQDLDEATQDLLRVFNVFVYDRLGAESPTEKILAIFDRHHRTSFGETEAAPPDATRAIGDPVFPYALYGEIVRAWKARRIFDTGLVDRMLAAMEQAVDAAEELGPVTREVARRVAAEEMQVESLALAQRELEARLDDILERMRTWKRLNDLIVRLRKIIDDQRALDERLDPSRPE